MSKTFVAVDRHGAPHLYDGTNLPSWCIRLWMRLRGWTPEPLITIGFDGSRFRDSTAVLLRVDDPGRIGSEPAISGGWPLPRRDEPERKASPLAMVCDLCGVGYPEHYSIRHR